MDLAQTTLELVSIPSVTGDEARLCQHVLEWSDRTLGTGHARRIANSVIVSTRGNRPVMGLFGHLDTVLPDSKQEYSIRDGRVYGCGASDMKGGLALMMAALTEALRWAYDLVAVFYEKEEGAYSDNGLEPLLEHLPAMEAAVVLEPTANAVQAGAAGGIHAMVTFRGKRGHSARPWQGDNAMYKAAPLLGRLAARERVPVEVGGLTFYDVMTATTATTCNSRNVVPDRFDINLNFRYAPGRDEAWARQQILDMVNGEAEVDFIDVAPPGSVSIDHPAFADWIRQSRLPVEPKQAWTDVARLTGRGIAAINFGPGDPAQAHQAGEFVDIDALHTGYRLLSDLLARP